jgi:hypothetical protein
MNSLCLRCGSEVTNDNAPTLHKCQKCENIRFDRKVLSPIGRKIIQNFQKLRKTQYGSFLTGLYQFGSYSEGKLECGDIDFLITFDEVKLNEFIEEEIGFSQMYYNLIDFGEDENQIPSSTLLNGFWDFNTCEEYPDCLDCHESGECNLPDEDYTSLIHTYCVRRCRKKIRIRLPDCCFSDCMYLDRQIKNRISKDIRDLLTDEERIAFVLVSPDFRIKAIDLLMKRSVDELREEFASMKVKKNLNLLQIF